MKRSLTLGVFPIILCVILLYLFGTYTHTGRVLSLYLFGAIKAPLSVKYDCIKETNDRVYTKFLQPLDFDEVSKDALREFWHFSYYRACLFTRGYDFFGTRFAPSSLTQSESGLTYTNDFGRVRMVVPEDTVIALDNAINPDMNDSLIASTLRIGADDIHVYIDRSYKLQSLADVRTNFAGFENLKDFPSPLLTFDHEGANSLAFTDGPYYGYVALVPGHHIITLFGTQGARQRIDEIASSLVVTK